MLKNLPQMSLNYLKKKAIQKTLEVTGDFIDNKSLIKLQNSQKLHHKINQQQLKVK